MTYTSTHSSPHSMYLQCEILVVEPAHIHLGSRQPQSVKLWCQLLVVRNCACNRNRAVDKETNETHTHTHMDMQVVEMQHRGQVNNTSKSFCTQVLVLLLGLCLCAFSTMGA